MSSSSKPKIISFKADGAITKGKAVKIGSDDEHVTQCSANTDLAIGVAQLTVTTAEDTVEVAMPGGGGKILLGESVVAGKYCVPHTDGSLVKANTLGDHIIAMPIEGGVTGDLVGAEIIAAHAAVAE